MAVLAVIKDGSVWIDFFIGSVVGSLKLATLFLVVFIFALTGLVIGTLTLYGETDLSYTTVGLSLMHQFFDNISLKKRDVDLEEFDLLFKAVNLSIYYLLIVYMLYAVFISIMHTNYRNQGIEKGDPNSNQELRLR